MSDNGSTYDLGESDRLNDNRIKKYNAYYKKSDNHSQNYKIYFCIIFFLLIIIIILLLVNLYFKLEKSLKGNTDYVPDNLVPTKNMIEDLLPKLNLNEYNESHTIKEILEARELFINDKNITNEYVKFFKTLSKEEDKIYKEKKYEGQKFHHYMEEARDNQLNYSDFYYLCNEEK